MDACILRLKASFMADFYTEVEKVLKLIVEEINGSVPKGEG